MSRQDDIENLLHEQNRLQSEANSLGREQLKLATEAREAALQKEMAERAAAERRREIEERIAMAPAQLDVWLKGGRRSFYTEEPRTVGAAQAILSTLHYYRGFIADVSGNLIPEDQKKCDQVRMTLEQLSKELSGTLTLKDWDMIKKKPSIEKTKEELKKMEFLHSVEGLFIEDRSKFELYLKLDALTIAKKCLYFGVPFLVLTSILTFVVDPAMIYFKTGKLTIFTMDRFTLTLAATATFGVVTEAIFRKTIKAFLFTYKKVYDEKATKLHAQLQKGYTHYPWAQYPDKKRDYPAAMNHSMDKVNHLNVIKLSTPDLVSVKAAWRKCEAEMADIDEIFKRPIQFKAA